MSDYKRTIFQVGLGAGMLLASAVLPATAGDAQLRQGFPGRRISGGTRSECMAGSPPVVALNPATNIGQTISDHPSVYFVIPDVDASYNLEFSLRDADGNRVYEKSLNTRTDQGLVGIQLPGQALQAERDYRWYFSIVCDAQDPTQNDVLSGWLRQVEVETVAESDFFLAAQDGIEAGLATAEAYRAAGLWNDAIETLVSLRELYPENASVRASWQQLLQALELEAPMNASVAVR
ncbi:MAG: DUF928 domain-containing protein [Cyanobacteria bacterium J06626_6]